MTEPITPLSAVGITRYHRPDRDYLQLRNNFARNAQLKLRAFRVASYILSHVDGFVQTQKQIAAACGLSVNTVRGALEDLREDRYLVSRRVREGGQWVGTAYAVSDIPFTDEELAQLCPPGAESEHADSERTESASPKKIIPSKKTSKDKKINPSGGSSAAAAAPTLESLPIHEQEESVIKNVDQETLFDVPAPEKKRKDGEVRSDPSPSAGTVVAAFVDSYQQNHSGGRPLQRDIGRVARDAKALLDKGEAGPDELAKAAAQMGEGQWSNLGMALKIFRQRGSRKGVQPGAPALPHTHPTWVAIAKEVEAETYQKLLTDDELVRWIAGDPSEADKWVSKHPELAARFESVA